MTFTGFLFNFSNARRRRMSLIKYGLTVGFFFIVSRGCAKWLEEKTNRIFLKIECLPINRFIYVDYS